MKPEIPNCFYRVSIKGLILDESRTSFLIIQEDNGKWELPGGGLDWGEKPEDCLKREIQEEMGLSVTWMSSYPSYFMAQQKKPNDIYVANVIFEVTLENLNFTASCECVAIQFITPEETHGLDVFPAVEALVKLFNPKNHVGT